MQFLKNFNHILIQLLQKVRKDARTLITIVGAFLGIVVSLNTLDILTPLWSSFLNIFSALQNFILSDFIGAPLLIWLILLLFYILYARQRIKVDIVAGDFKDDFGEGLSKWDYGNEGWSIEYEEKRPLLSVSESQEGGISKKGFTWSDYEVSFETKPIKRNLGWIMRAENRSKFLMIQLNMEQPDRTLLRLHLKVPGSGYPWVVIQEDKIKSIKFYKWIKVRTVVLGNNIDVYFDDDHIMHYFIADPIAIPTSELVRIRDEDRKTFKKIYIERDYVTMNYSIGKVGFRCAPSEHAHFRNVRVEPIL